MSDFIDSFPHNRYLAYDDETITVDGTVKMLTPGKILPECVAVRKPMRPILKISSLVLLLCCIAGPGFAQTGSSTTKPCVATAAAPTYTEGSRVELSCDLAGTLRSTAAGGVTVSVNRRSTASSGGTTATAAGTGADSVSKMDPSDGNWGGVVRRTGTLGTIGATLSQVGFQVGELAAGTADPTGLPVFCKDFGQNGEKMPTVVSGVANGLSITVPSLGAGGLAFGSIEAVFIAE